jgi:hypothetical protein
MGRGVASAVRVGLGVALLGALAGCGGDDSPRPPVVVVTPEPVRGVIAQTSFSGFEPDVWISIELVLSQKGVLDVTVDWTFTDTWLYMYLGRTNCNYDQLTGRTCPFFLSSETQTPKPRILVTESLEPGTYYLVLYNVPWDRKMGVGSINVESVSLQLGLTVYPSGQRSTTAVHLGRVTTVSPPRLPGP